MVLLQASRQGPEDMIRKIAAFLGIDSSQFPPLAGAQNAYARPANAFARQILGNQILRLAVRVLPNASAARSRKVFY